MKEGGGGGEERAGEARDQIKVEIATYSNGQVCFSCTTWVENWDLLLSHGAFISWQ